MSDKTEEWREVPGFKGYFVSNLGQVKGSRGPKLKQEVVKHNYKRVTLCIDGKTTRFSVHRLVMLTFHGPSELDVRHLDGNPANNDLSNLAYGTKHENEQDKRLVGTYQRHEKNPFSKLTEEEVEWFKDIYLHHKVARTLQGHPRTKMGIRQLMAAELGVSVGCLKNIISGRNWQC